MIIDVNIKTFLNEAVKSTKSGKKKYVIEEKWSFLFRGYVTNGLIYIIASISSRRQIYFIFNIMLRLFRDIK